MPVLSGWCEYDATGTRTKNVNGTDHGFPEMWNRTVEMYDKLAADNGKAALTMLDGVNKVFQSKPMTVIHGDLNSGNFWVNKKDDQKYLLADWQAVRFAFKPSH